MKLLQTVLASIFLFHAGSASAGYIFSHGLNTTTNEAGSDGTLHWASDIVRQPVSPEGITYLGDRHLRCNSPQQLGRVMNYTLLNAGQKIGFKIVPDERGGDASITHPGPASIYMAKIHDNIQNWDQLRWYDGPGDIWYKIAEWGVKKYTPEGPVWEAQGRDELITTIPDSTPPGWYLARVEHIALHNVDDGGLAEIYAACQWLWVVNGGNVSAPGIMIPPHIPRDHPGITTPLKGMTSYQMPGPAVWRV